MTYAKEGTKAKGTQIHIWGEFTKEQLAKLMREVWKIQKGVNPKHKSEKMFLIWISNDFYTDAEVREILRENFKDIKVTDLVEESGDEIQKALSKRSAM